MGTWHDLPHEIQNLILYHFCVSVANEFESLRDNVWDSVADEFFTSHPMEWTELPKSLHSFISALCTCQYFRNVITDRTKIDGETPTQLMQKIQYENVRHIIDVLQDEVSSTSIHIGIFFLASGCFWKNVKVIEDENLLVRVLMWIPQGSCGMLIPYLQPWLLARQKDFEIHDTEHNFGLCIDIGEESYLELQFICRGEARASSDEVIHSVAGLKAGPINGIEGNNDFSLFIESIENAPPNSWWSFPTGDLFSEYIEVEWCLVNYDKKTLWLGPSLQSISW